MQKIVFVGIILIIGLFSLQFSLAPFYTNSFQSYRNLSTSNQVSNESVKVVEHVCEHNRVFVKDTIVEDYIPGSVIL